MLDFIRLNKLLKDKGIKKSFIADRLGKSRSLLNDWENGKSQPSDSSLEIIAEILGTTVAYLTGETDEKEATHEEIPLSDKSKRLLATAADLSDEELEKVIEYAEFVKSKRK